MATGIQTYIFSATIDGTTHTNKWMDIEDIFAPRGTATKISNVGIQNTAGTDISNLFLPIAGGSKLAESTGLKNTGNVDLTDLFAVKGSGLADTLAIINASTSGTDINNSFNGGTVDLRISTHPLPKDWTAYTFSWSGFRVLSQNANIDSNGPTGTNNRQYRVYLDTPGPAFASGDVDLTVTDNATGESVTISNIGWDITIEDSS